jgi:hypothetical protein
VRLDQVPQVINEMGLAFVLGVTLGCATGVEYAGAVRSVIRSWRMAIAVVVASRPSSCPLSDWLNVTRGT